MLQLQRHVRRVSAVTKRRLGACGVLVGLATIITVVALSCGTNAPRAMDATTLSPLSPEGVQVTSGYSGDLVSGASFTAVAGDLGLTPGKDPSVSAPSAIVLGEESGGVLFSRNPDKRMPMASTTKIMTALLVLETLPLGQEVTASARAQATDECQIDLREGEVMTVEDLLYALLVGSANDAAVALAEAAAGNEDAFVQEMNKEATALGLSNTHFANPHGLDASGHYSSARDLAVLARYAMSNSEFRELVGTLKHSVASASGQSPRSLTNHNVLLGEFDWVTGVKTGFTSDAGFCLVASGQSNGVSVISVVLGEASKQACWDDSRSLLEYGLGRQRRVIMIPKGTAIAETDLPYESSKKLGLVTEQAVELSLSPGDEIVVTAQTEEELRLPVEAGQRFGRLAVSVRGEIRQTVALVAERSCPGPTLGSKLVYLCGRLFR